jgi:hypothetical protein
MEFVLQVVLLKKERESKERVIKNFVKLAEILGLVKDLVRS